MTFSKYEFYGGSKHIVFAAGNTTYTIGYGDYTRVLYFTEDDILATVEVNLPDATKVDQLGWMYYFLANDTSADMEVRNHSGALITTLNPGECGAVGNVHKNDSDGGWFIDTAACVHDPPPPPPPPTVSFGGAFLNHDTWLFQHFTNSWTQAANTPVDSHFAQAVNVKKIGNNEFRSFWKHLTVHYEYVVDLDTHTNKSTAPTSSEQTGSARLRDGNGFSVELYLNWGSLATENTPIIYDATIDTWTFAAVLTGQRPGQGSSNITFGECMTSAGPTPNPAGPGDIWYAYMITTEPVIDADLFEWPYFWAYDGTTDTHHQLPMISATPVPPNRHQASMVNLDEAVHVVGGSVVVGSPDIPEDASARHVRYTGGLGGSWFARPQLPDPVMGMGIETITGVSNKFTLGMGNHGDTVTGSAQHWEYDESTQAYRVRAIDNWFQKNTQQGSWCVGGTS